MHMSDLADCMTTLEQTKTELEALEAKLAEKYGLSPRMPVHDILVALDQVGELDHGELVADWRATFARFLDWAEPAQGWEHPEPDKPSNKSKESNSEAANTAAFALLCVAMRARSTTVAGCGWVSSNGSDGRSSVFSRA
jgi:hypothetical protein